MAEPIRTCLGCRERHERSALLRVVAEQVDGHWAVQPDPRGHRPGRGAWLHYDLGCLGRAESRGAFGRALRIGGRPDSGAVSQFLSENSAASSRKT